MKAKKRNIISFAICALFVAGLLAGSCYIKEGKQNAVSGYAAKEQGQIKWAYETETGNSDSPALNVRVVGMYQNGEFTTDIMQDIIIPDKVPECDKKGNIIYDTETKDIEIVPWKINIDDYMTSEVLPYVPDAKAFFEEDLSKKKPVIKTGAEIPFTRYFYKYQAPASSDELANRFNELEASVNLKIKKLFGGN